MEDTTFDLHKSLEDRNWWFVAHMRIIRDLIAKLMEDRGFLDNLVGITRPGSRILITVPAGKKLWDPHDVAAGMSGTMRPEPE